MFDIRPLAPGDAGWVLEHHAVHYAEVEGFDATFEALVAQVLADLLHARRAGRAEGWLAWAGGMRRGCIFAASTEDNALQLRLFYVARAARGQGIGQALLDTLVAHARARGCASVRLWTHAEHAAAGRVYARNGFRRLSASPAHSFGRDLTEEAWELPLGSG